jgi:hypothetical protein
MRQGPSRGDARRRENPGRAGSGDLLTERAARGRRCGERAAALFQNSQEERSRVSTREENDLEK